MKAVLDSRHIPAMEAVFDVPTNISYLRPKKQDAFSYWATMDFETKEALNIQTDVLYEAYRETEKEFYEHSVEKKPIFFKDYFDTNFLRYLKHKWFPKKDIY